MVNITNNEISWRCYGQDDIGELKRDIRVNINPPTISPKWCPKRKVIV
jgi:hypothetical protein